VDARTVETILRGIGADQVTVASPEKVTCCCPLAFWTHPKGRDNRPSMVVFVEGDKKGRPYYSCLSCHDKGTLRDMLLFLWTRGYDVFQWIEVLDGEVSADKVQIKSAKLKADFKRGSKQGFDHLAERYQKKNDRPFYDYKAVLKAEQIEELPWATYEPYAGSVPRYALDRGLTIETCKEWDLGHDPRMKRLLFPIRDRKGRLVAVSGRIYVDNCPKCGGTWIRPCDKCGCLEEEHIVEDDQVLCIDGSVYQPTRAHCSNCGMMQQPKYLHSKGFPRRFILYGEHRQEKAPDGRVYVVEGHLDMIKMWQFGYRPVVALLGSHPSPPQIEKLIQYWQKIIVVPDGNQAGTDMGKRVKKMVADRIEVTVKKVPDKTDPGAMTFHQFQDLLGQPTFPQCA